MSFLSAEGLTVQNQTLTLEKGLQSCQEVFVYIKVILYLGRIREKLIPNMESAQYMTYFKCFKIHC